MPSNFEDVFVIMTDIYEYAKRHGGTFNTDELRYTLRCTKQSLQRYRHFQKAIEYLRLLGWIKKPGRNGVWVLRDPCLPQWSPPSTENQVGVKKHVKRIRA